MAMRIVPRKAMRASASDDEEVARYVGTRLDNFASDKPSID